MKSLFILLGNLLFCASLEAQLKTIEWPAGRMGDAAVTGRMVLDLSAGQPLFRRVELVSGVGVGTRATVLLRAADPVFRLSVGTRDLVSQNGWNIFFDKVPLKPYRTFSVEMEKDRVAVHRHGTRTLVKVGKLRAGEFQGWLEIELFDGTGLFNIAAVMHTERDSTAILYDAGLVSRERIWDSVVYYGVDGKVDGRKVDVRDSVVNQAVKYRAIAGRSREAGVGGSAGEHAAPGAGGGSLVVFPAPHQYFYPLDEAFNLKFTWFGRMGDWPYGIGIRQDPMGDHRYVPWFNAPPETLQRLNFFCLLRAGDAVAGLDEVRRYTHDDRYVPLPGYKTMSSHYHNEYISKVVLAGKPVLSKPSFVGVFERAGVNIVHLAEFHGVGHPRGPDSLRLRELDALFGECRRLSGGDFLLLPGEEPNEFFGGHWLAFFPKPVYWVMSGKNAGAQDGANKPGENFESNDPVYGKVYHIADTADMLRLLKEEDGLAWTAHPRTKGSTGYPDKYKDEGFFRSDRFLGGAWKAMPADLSQQRLGKRVLDLMDDMNNWGLGKRVLAEADLFTIEPENEMYAHMNVNYLRMGKLPVFKKGWKSILDTLQRGRFFSTTGEVLIPSFAVNGVGAGDTARLGVDGKARIVFSAQWTFPLRSAELISGDGVRVYRHAISLDGTGSFGKESFHVALDLSGRKWVRLEVWDAAVDGAFTQTVWLR